VAPEAPTEEARPRPPAPKPSSIPTPAQIPTPKMMARPRPTPPAGAAPSVPAPAPVAPVTEPEAPTMDPVEVAAAREHGRVAEDGTVYVRDTSGERVVGQFPDVSEDEALSLYIRRYLDLKAQVELLGARLAQLTIKVIDVTLRTLTETLVDPDDSGGQHAMCSQ